jgi:hypothetical protein
LLGGFLQVAQEVGEFFAGFGGFGGFFLAVFLLATGCGDFTVGGGDLGGEVGEPLFCNALLGERGFVV